MDRLCKVFSTVPRTQKVLKHVPGRESMLMLKCHHPLLLNTTAKSQYVSGQRDELKCVLSIMEIYIASRKRCFPHKAAGHVFSLDTYTISSSFYHPHYNQGCPGDSDGKESVCSAGDLGLIPGSGRSPGERNDNLIQDSCLENPMGGGAWWATVYAQPGPWGSCYERTQELTHSGNFHLQQHQVSWENTSSSRSNSGAPSQLLTPLFSSFTPSSRQYNLKKKKKNKKTAFGILLQQS